MKLLILLCLMISFSAVAQDKIDLTGICLDRPQGLIVLDGGFCDEFLKLEADSQVKESILKVDKGLNINSDPLCLDEKKPEQTDKWKIRFYASHSNTQYFNTDVTFNSSRYNVVMKDYEWAARSSKKYFYPKTWQEEGNNPFQAIDEPTNTFVLSLEKNGHEFFLSAFHPKFLQAGDQVKHIIGNIDGTDVDEFAPVNRPFDGYNQTPGESELVRNENTHLQMTFELGYGYRFKLLDSKIGSISYVPSIGLGVMVGQNYSVIIKENDWWEFDDYKDDFGVQGFGGSITNRIEFNTKKERFGIFYENKLAFYKQKHGFLDGTQEYNLGFMGNSLGIKFMIHNPNNRKSSKKIN